MNPFGGLRIIIRGIYTQFIGACNTMVVTPGWCIWSRRRTLRFACGDRECLVLGAISGLRGVAIQQIFPTRSAFYRKDNQVDIPPIEPPGDGPVEEKRLPEVPSKDSGEDDPWATSPHPRT